jgi:hypothetical protein
LKFVEKKSQRLFTPSKAEEEKEEGFVFVFRQVCVVPKFPRGKRNPCSVSGPSTSL